MVSLPARLGLAWLAASLGAVAPIVVNDPAHALDYLPWQGAFMPFYLALMAAASGWWSIIAFPLLFVQAWHVIRFMCRERPLLDLLRIAVVAYPISIRGCEVIWPYGLVVAWLGCSSSSLWSAEPGKLRLTRIHRTRFSLLLQVLAPRAGPLQGPRGQAYSR